MSEVRRNDLLRGTLEMLVLRILDEDAAHGYAIARRIEQATDDALRIEEGSLYPALHRMEKRGWIDAEWGKTQTNRRARIYRLTSDGRERMRREISSWSHFSAAVAKVVEPGR